MKGGMYMTVPSEADADQDRIINIREDKKSLHLLDSRIEKAIVQCDARLLILDPLQGYLGERIDMNRANEIREVMKSVGQVAQRTGCAVVLVGHLNKAAGLSSAYRGLGSIGFRAAARSVLVVGRLRKNKTVRIVVHDKSSLAPEGKSLAFQLGDEEGFRWLDGYDEISAEELLSGFSSQPETKTAQAEELIRSMLEDGAELHCEEIIRAAADRQISRRTVNEAKKNTSGIVTRKAGARWLWSMVLHRASSMKKSDYNFKCYTYGKRGRSECTPHHIREEELYAVVLDDLRRVTHFARQKERQFAEYINRKNTAQLRQEINTLQKELDTMRRRRNELTALFKRLYEDNVLGRVTDEQYRMLAGDYTVEQKALEEQIPEKEARLEKLKAASANVNTFVEKAKQYTAIDELTPELLRLFIQRIEVGERAEKYSRSSHQSVRIVYRDIGTVDSAMEQGEAQPRIASPLSEVFQLPA